MKEKVLLMNAEQEEVKLRGQVVLLAPTLIPIL